MVRSLRAWVRRLGKRKRFMRALKMQGSLSHKVIRRRDG